MPLSLDDILSMPHDPSEEHLRSIGLLPQVPPTPSIVPHLGTGEKIPALSPVNAPVPPVATGDWRSRLAATAPRSPAPSAPLPPLSPVGAPDLSAGPTPEMPATSESATPGVSFPKLAPLNFKERQALPATSEGVAPGSKESFEAQLQRIQDQKNNPWGSPENHPGLLGKIGHYAAKIGNIAGDVIAPATMANIPGTDLNRQVQEHGLEHQIAGAGKAEEEAKTGESERELRSAQTKKALAEAEKEPVEKPENMELDTYHDLMSGDNGNPRINPDTGHPFSKLEALEVTKQATQKQTADKDKTLQQDYANAVRDAQRRGVDPLQDNKVKEIGAAIGGLQKETAKPDEDEKKIKEVLGAKNWPDTPANRLKAREVLKDIGKTPEDEETRDLKKEILRDRKEKMEQPSNDEQRRADLGRNMLENINELEGLAKARPDLFGPAAGRWTQLKNAIGTSDPAIARLFAIKEYLGMASVGAHSMRNAQHVGTAADAVMNSFHNSPTAMLAAAEQAKKSVQTFLNDEKRNKNRALGITEGTEGGAGGGGGHSFTINGKEYENVPDDVYERAKKKPGFKE